MRVAVIGLDGLDPRVLARHFPQLPTFRALLASSLAGSLRTCHPPITVPAWAVMASGRDPGELGFTGFRNLRRGTYDTERTVTARDVRVLRVWDVAGEAGRRVLVHGVPPSWPPPVVAGFLTSCFLTPSPDDGWTWPPKLADDLAPGGDVLLDVPQYRRADRSALASDLARYANQRWDIAERLLTIEPRWDLFWMVDMSTDRLAHAFLRDEETVARHLALIDARLARVLARCQDAAVLLVSDHGARPLDGVFAINDWLRAEGLLTLRHEPDGPAAFRAADVDWERTTAWAMGGYYARVFVNLKGREPAGRVEPARYDETVADLARRLRAIPLPDGRPMGNVVLRREEAWTGPHVRDAPDLVVYLGNLAWRATQGVGRPSLWETLPEVGPDSANHDWDGVFALRAPGLAPGRRDISIYDVAPTVLSLLGLDAPAGLRGRSVLA